MTETGRFATRPWTPADDEILRSLALRGEATRVIRKPAKSNCGCCAVSRQKAEHPAQENHTEARSDGLKAKGK
jgi:hypothetical protein